MKDKLLVVVDTEPVTEKKVNKFIGTDSNSLHAEATKLLRDIGDGIYFKSKYESGEITTLPTALANIEESFETLYDVLEILKENLNDSK